MKMDMKVMFYLVCEVEKSFRQFPIFSEENSYYFTCDISVYSETCVGLYNNNNSIQFNSIQFFIINVPSQQQTPITETAQCVYNIT
jgi:hypothetical protein